MREKQLKGEKVLFWLIISKVSAYAHIGPRQKQQKDEAKKDAHLTIVRKQSYKKRLRKVIPFKISLPVTCFLQVGPIPISPFS